MAYHNSGDLRADRRYDLAKIYFDEGDYTAALDLIEQSLELLPERLPSLYLHQEILFHLGRIDEAKDVCRTLISFDDDDIFGGKLALSRLLGDVPVISPAYVASLFDDYANRFEKSLLVDLHYKGPSLIQAALQDCIMPYSFNIVLDIGCGTGLMGKQIDSAAKRLIGSDISNEMLLIAESKNIYDDLYHGDMVTHLEQFTAEIDLIIAADVFIYVGDLTNLFDRVHKALSSGGYFAFTVQAHKGDDYSFGEDWRYHHSKSYLMEKLKAFHVKRFEEVILRYNKGIPVINYLVIAQKFKE